MLPFWPGLYCKINNASQGTSWLNIRETNNFLLFESPTDILQELQGENGGECNQFRLALLEDMTENVFHISNNTTPSFTRCLIAKALARILEIREQMQLVYLLLFCIKTVKFKHDESKKYWNPLLICPPCAGFQL